VTVTTPINVIGCCGSPAILCKFVGPSCDCVGGCAGRKLEVRCDLPSTGTGPCECYLNDSLVGSCSQPPLPPDIYAGCGGRGFGCCNAFFPVTP
jgi:hypothetical protein